MTILSASLTLALCAHARAQNSVSFGAQLGALPSNTRVDLGLDPSGNYGPVAIDGNHYQMMDCATGCGGGSSNASVGALNSSPTSLTAIGFKGTGGLTPPSATAPLPTGDSLADAALGTPSDTAWGGTGSGSTIALQKALYGALLANTSVNASYSSVVSNPAVGGGTVTAGRGIQMSCTAAGNVVLVLSNGGSLTYPIVAAPSVAIQPLAVVSVTSQTATCTFANLN